MCTRSGSPASSSTPSTSTSPSPTNRSQTRVGSHSTGILQIFGCLFSADSGGSLAFQPRTPTTSTPTSYAKSLNDGPAQFADYGLHLAAVTLHEGAHLIVRAPRNEYLLGMKVQAARPEDVDDTVWLMADTGLRASAELHQAAADVSRSIGKEWSPDRRRKKFVKTCVRQHRRQARARRRRIGPSTA